jgi:hypothetical protein
MKRGLHKLLTLLLLLGFATQPLLLQARAISHATPPCPMQMQQQMGHHDMAQQGDCANHAACADCELCGQSAGSMLAPLSSTNVPAYDGVAAIDTYRGAFVSIALTVDSPPPRTL